jgi:hypothetical protein
MAIDGGGAAGHAEARVCASSVPVSLANGNARTTAAAIYGHLMTHPSARRGHDRISGSQILPVGRHRRRPRVVNLSSLFPPTLRDMLDGALVYIPAQTDTLRGRPTLLTTTHVEQYPTVGRRPGT